MGAQQQVKSKDGVHCEGPISAGAPWDTGDVNVQRTGKGKRKDTVIVARDGRNGVVGMATGTSILVGSFVGPALSAVGETDGGTACRMR